MSVPDQTRLTLVKYKPETPEDHAENLRTIERWGNDLLLPRYATAQKFALSVWSHAISFAPLAWASDGSGLSQIALSWTKRFEWTDVMVDLTAMFYATTNPCSGDIWWSNIHAEDIGVTGFTNTRVASYTLDVINSHEIVNGWCRVSGLRAGAHLAQVAVTMTDTIAVNAFDFGQMRIMEIPPEE